MQQLVSLHKMLQVLRHRLRSPLTVVKGVVDDLAAGYVVEKADLLDAQQALAILNSYISELERGIESYPRLVEEKLADTLLKLGKHHSWEIVLQQNVPLSAEEELLVVELSYSVIQYLSATVKQDGTSNYREAAKAALLANISAFAGGIIFEIQIPHALSELLLQLEAEGPKLLSSVGASDSSLFLQLASLSTELSGGQATYLKGQDGMVVFNFTFPQS